MVYCLCTRRRLRQLHAESMNNIILRPRSASDGCGKRDPAGRSEYAGGILSEMKTYTYTPEFVCSREIHFSIEDGKLYHVSFTSGCNGNLKAISKLVEGRDAAQVAQILRGNDCNGRGTSCADQFAKAIEAALEEESESAQ